MFQRKKEYTPKNTKKALKKFSKNKDGDGIKKIAKLFNIPIDESRLEDYKIEIKEIKNLPYITIIDRLTNITYISHYTNKVEQLNYTSKKLEFIKSNILTPTHIIEKIYYINNDNKDNNQPIIEKMTFRDEKYKLELERENKNDIISYYEGPKFTIRYTQIPNDNNPNNLSPTLTKIYRNNENIYEELFEEKYPILNNNSTLPEINEQHTRIEYDSTAYFVTKRDDNYYFRGICLENLKSTIRDCFSQNNMSLNNISYLKNRNTISGMIFEIHDNYCNKSLIIYKNAFRIHIEYVESKHNFKIIDHESILPSLTRGNISNEEIQYIITELQNIWSNDEFINLILNELTKFGEKIEYRQKKNKEICSLNPEIFINKSFNEISNLINNNKIIYFELIKQELKLYYKTRKNFLRKVKEKKFNPTNN